MRIHSRQRLVHENSEMLAVPTGLILVWFMDYMGDQNVDGWMFRPFNVSDEINYSMSPLWVIHNLERVVEVQKTYLCSRRKGA